METEAVVHYRPLLFAIAYRMLGTVADAEDAVQETFLRHHRALADGTAIDSPKAWLTAVTTRLCIDQLRSARARREHYVGPWLPEPLVDVEATPRLPAPATDEAAMLADSLSTAFLVLLESLSPKERAVFLLHDVFEFAYAEIAAIIGESEAYCRQIARRARAHVSERRPRFSAPPERREQLLERFLAAVEAGDLAGLIAMLSEDVTIWSDGGGRTIAARKPVRGRAKVAQLLVAIARHAPADTTRRVTFVNGQPGVVTWSGGRPLGVLTFNYAGDAIHDVYIVVNPDKLATVPPAAT